MNTITVNTIAMNNNNDIFHFNFNYLWLYFFEFYFLAAGNWRRPACCPAGAPGNNASQ